MLDFFFQEYFQMVSGLLSSSLKLKSRSGPERTGEFFSTIFLNSPSSSQADRWIKVQGKVATYNSTFFVVNKFSVKDSGIITDCLSKPDTMCFHDDGHIRCGKLNGSPRLVFMNNVLFPTATKQKVFYPSALVSIQDQHSEIPKIWHWDDTKIMNHNGTYILFKKQGQWHLLYNFFHTSQFAAFYRSNPDVGRRVVTNYCNLRIHSNTKHEMYMDPVCAMIRSDKNCAYSAFLDMNRVIGRIPGETEDSFGLDIGTNNQNLHS